MPKDSGTKGAAGQPPVRTKTKEPIPLYILLALLIIGGIVLFTFNIYFIIEPEVIYSITSGGASTFSILDGKLTFILDNNINAPEKVMMIYGLYNNTIDFMISGSDLVGDMSERNIPSKDVLFNNVTRLLIKNGYSSSPQRVSISIDHKQTGLYHGAIFITGQNNTSIPITVDIKPTLDRVIIWVINGIAIAIIFWKVVKFYNQRYERMPNNTYRILNFRDFLSEKKITWGTIGKNFILDVGSTLFGILTGVFALLNNTFITDIRILDIPSIIVLIGVGLGIGSLKEYIYAASEPKN